MRLQCLLNYFSLLVLCSLVALIIKSVAFIQPQPWCREDERSALLEFKRSFNISCDNIFTDEYPKMLSWEHSENCCMWDGVECNKETSHVIGIDLGNSCLVGSFPQNSSIFMLKHLEYLSLYENQFNHSQIPQGIGQLNNLRSLDLSYSQFSGQIPLEIAKLSHLHTLDLSYSDGISDPLAEKLLKLHNPNLEALVCNLTSIRNLALDLVDISSKVPACLSNLTSLQYLTLVSTDLRGEFPNPIVQLPHLEIFNISYNDHLTGVLPEFRRNNSLRELSISFTRLSGKLPSSIGHLRNLNLLQLESSIFTGEWPSSFANLTELTELHIANTSITITPDFFSMLSKHNKITYLSLDELNLASPMAFPPALRNLTKLNVFSAVDSGFVGPIPSWVSNLTQLQVLDLQACCVYSSHANTDFNLFSKLQRLEVLKLSDVNLIFPSDNITNTIISFPQFRILILRSCNITEFPQFLRNQHNLSMLSLTGNRIHGSIPHWLGNTSTYTLHSVSLTSNFLTGFEQSPPVIPWRNIQLLNLDDNKLQGSVPIPPASLLIYRLSNNLLTNIPESICHTPIAFLDLSYNNLSGQIPKCFDSLADSLKVLDLQANKLHGSIPLKFSNSCNLRAINLNKNQLEGNLPRSLANCSSLQLVDIGDNQLNDTFPSWMGNLQFLQVLVLRYNRFHGSMFGDNAATLSYEFPNLLILDMSSNFLRGPLPVQYMQNWHSMRYLDPNQYYLGIYESYTAYGMGPMSILAFYNYRFSSTNKGTDTLYSRILSVLKVIDLSNNNFTGKIPDSIGNLRGLVALNISNNVLTEEIPSSLRNLTGLQCLDLSHNKLSGQIPNALTQLTDLEIFNVSHNHLTGPIPHGHQFDTFDESSFYGNLGLCGNLMLKSCGTNTDNQPPSHSNLDEDYEDETLLQSYWVVGLLGCGGGLVVGILGGSFFTDKYHEWFVEIFGRKQKKMRKKIPRRSRR